MEFIDLGDGKSNILIQRCLFHDREYLVLFVPDGLVIIQSELWRGEVNHIDAAAYVYEDD